MKITSTLFAAAVALTPFAASAQSAPDGPPCERGANGPGGGHPHARFEEADADGDGALSLDEFLAQGDPRFDRMDANGDGFVTTEEAAVVAEEMRARHAERHAERFGDGERPEPPEGAPERPERGDRPGPPPFEDMLAQIDSDGDGQVSADEAEAQRAMRFATLDSDGDGLLTQDEMRAGFRGHGPRGGRGR